MNGRYVATMRASTCFLWAMVTISATALTFNAVGAMVHGDPSACELWAALAVAEVTGATVWTSILNGRLRALGDRES